jgi:DNA-binding FadR family transcriptional regulator
VAISAGRRAEVISLFERVDHWDRRRRCYHPEHTAIVDALRDRDPDGAQVAMHRHLHNVADSLLGRR